MNQWRIDKSLCNLTGDGTNTQELLTYEKIIENKCILDSLKKN